MTVNGKRLTVNGKSKTKAKTGKRLFVIPEGVIGLPSGGQGDPLLL